MCRQTYIIALEILWSAVKKQALKYKYKVTRMSIVSNG